MKSASDYSYITENMKEIIRNYPKELQDAWEGEERWDSNRSYNLNLPEDYELNNPKTIKAISNLLKNPKDRQKSICLFGDVGCGKTYLSNIIADSIIPYKYRHDNYKFVSVPQLWGNIKEAYNRERALSELTQPYPYMIIDDLGAEDRTEASSGAISSFLYRIHKYYENGRVRMLVVTTNLGLDQIEERYGTRIKSRFLDMFLLCILKGEDFRAKRARGVSE